MAVAKLRIAGAAIAALAALLVCAPGAWAGTFVVDSNGDTSHGVCAPANCTLRDAIDAANANTGADQIHFNIAPSGPQEIDVATALPNITDPVTIDGTTQPGFLGPPIIRVDGGTNFYDGFFVDAGGAGSVIRGLTITRFGSSGITVAGDNVAVVGNDIGTDSAGSVSLGNGLGIQAFGANATIGGTTAADRNVISGNSGFISYGIYLSGGGTGTVVSGNYVGTTPDGLSALPNGSKGIEVDPGATATIGGDNTGAGTPACDGACNLISGNNNGGIESYGTVTIQGNWIGVGADGTTALANGAFGGGIITGGGATIGGATAAKRNVIAGLHEGAISVSGSPASSVTIQGNYIGVDPGGLTAMPNAGQGITVNSTTGVQIGGSNAGEGNVISQNTGDGFVVGDAGILLYNASDGAHIEGNVIGMDAAQTASGFGNTGPGVYVRGSANVVIGGTTGTTPGTACTGACNVITSNTGAGVRIDDFNGFFSTGASVQGNYIGTNSAGSATFPNHDGVSTNSQGTTIGGTTASARNIIAGSTSFGVIVSSSGDDAVIAGNYIGTDPGGTVDFGNGSTGVLVGTGATNVVIGGAVAGAGNLISGNGSGVSVKDDSTIQGNLIGTQADGTSARGNSGPGISADGDGNVIGDSSVAGRNVIAANSGPGITLTGGAGNTIQGNYVGADATGNTPLANGGNAIDTSGETDLLIGGTNPGEGNVIGGSALEVVLDGSDGAVVQGNSIGVGADGGSDIGFHSCACVGAGIKVVDLAEVPSPVAPLIGGDTAAARNLIAAGVYGVWITTQADGTEVQGNWIGLNSAGNVSLNDADGVRVESSDSVVVGGSNAGEGNVISGNGGAGVFNALDASNTVIQGNYIGTNPAGTGVRQNSTGIADNGLDTTIGGLNTGGAGACTGECNLISGNTGAGISGSAAAGLVIEGNWVGVDSTGAVALPNTTGISITGGTAGIGDVGANLRNVVSGNTQDGIDLNGGAATAYNVLANYVGTNAAGTAAIPNGKRGIQLIGTNQAEVGGSNPGEGNLISGNGTDPGLVPPDSGIEVTGAGDGNVINGNLIGTDAAGTGGLGNTDYGIYVHGATNTLVGGSASTTPGGACTGECNVIDASPKYAILVEDDGSNLSSNTTIEGNVLGLDVTGTTKSAALGNDIGAILLRSDHATIGGSTAGSRNVISGNDSWGVVLDSTAVHTDIQGNYIGTDTTGMLARGNGSTGVFASSGASGVTIGGSAAGQGNVISGNLWGIAADADGVVVQGNLIGTNVAGAAALGNAGIGVNVSGAGSTIGGSTANERNVISGNGTDGIRLQGPNNTVSGNYIGTNAAGTAAIANVFLGVEITGAGANNNTIGGNTAALRNVISGNNNGVMSQGGAAGTKIQGNYIGTNAAGTAAIANGQGVNVAGGATVGGSNPGEGNLISGNTFDQVYTQGGSPNTVAGNVIGLDAAGTTNLNPGFAVGVEAWGAGTVIGGAGGAHNVISGDRDAIIVRDTGDNTVIRNNYIGTNVAGTAAVANRYGIWLDKAAGVDIGGPAPADGNVISGWSHGVLVDGVGADGTQIRNNYIGTDKTGTVDLGNGFGVDIDAGSTTTEVGAGPSQGNLISGNTVGILIPGGTSTGNTIDDNRIGPNAFGNSGIGNGTGIDVAGDSTVRINSSYSNTIAYNSGIGVRVETTTGQATISSNDIYSNGGLGIDLDPPTGVDTNDSADGDGGPNNGQNYPVITNAVSGGNIDFSLDSKQGDYMVDFFRSSSCDPSGHGEGETFFISRLTHHTNADGNQLFSTPAGPLPPGSYITATATSDGNGPTITTGDTSEFSTCFHVAAASATYTVDRTDDVGGLACTAVAGDCDLRSAIEHANANSGAADTIDFDLPLAGVNTIDLSSDLPAITDPVTIDGTTQSGFVGPPIVVVDGGSGSGNLSTGLELAAGSDGSTVRGLVIGNFDVAGILLDSGGNTIAGNYIGVDWTGGGAFANGVGISAKPSSDNNVIGGGNPLDRNVVSGNTQYGIELAQGGGNASDSDSVLGNYIGINAAGIDALANGGDGIRADGGSDLLIGGIGAGEGNVVSGNLGMGIRLENTSNAKIQGNYVGVDAGGLAPVGNDYGINLRSSTDTTIGGTTAAARNVVSGNLSGMYLEFNDGTIVQGNFVGLGADGVTNIGNIDSSPTAGITVDQASLVPGATPTLIGGTVSGAENYISGNTEGIQLLDADAGTTIKHNYIGLDTNWNGAGNLHNGIDVFDTPGVVIGGPTVNDRNFISDNSDAGVLVEDSADIAIQGNFIGTDPAGTDSKGNGAQGIYVIGDSPNATIGGAATPDAGDPPGNLIVDHNNEGILLEGGAGLDPRGAHIRGNMIGLDSTGSATLPNYGSGIAITNGAHDNVVGNDTGSGSDYNVISASGDGGEPGVWIDGGGSDNNKVVGNRLGTNRDGTNTGPFDTQNGNDTGVTISGGAQHNTVGGTTPDLRNLIGANNTGVDITDGATAFNNVQGNWIGIAIDGATALENDYGIAIENDAHGNLIGGAGAGAGNLIAASTYDGISIDGAGGIEPLNNAIKGNSIGVAADLTTPLGQDLGMELTNAANLNVIGREGGDPASAANLIVGSADANVLVNNNSLGNDFIGNTIKDGQSDGIRILNGSDNNSVVGNTITGNAEAGVAVGGPLGNEILQNSIDNNGGLGIDLGAPGVLPNDPGDVDSGIGNEGQNYPDLTDANVAAGDLTVDGTIDSMALFSGNPAHYSVELFASPACDTPGGNGEGRTFIGNTGVVVDGAGHATWQITDNGTSVTPGQVVTATATDEDGNTSEFSQCFTVTNVVTPLSGTIDLTQDSANVRAGAQSVPISGIDLGALTRGAGPNTASAPLDGIPLEGIKIAGSPLEGIPLEGIGLTPQILNQALGGVHLSDIPLTPPANWPALLAGTRLANVPLSTLTLADVLSLPSLPAGFHDITLGSVDLSSSPLEGIPLGGIALGPKLLSAVPLEGIATTTPAQNLQDWCDAINATPGYSCSNPSVTLANETVISQVVRGVPLDGIPLDGIPLEGINLAGTPLEGIPLEGIDLSGTPLEGIPLEGINMSVSPLEGIPLEGINIIGSPLEGIPLEGIPLVNSAIECTGGFCLPSAHNTLGDAVNENRVKPGATLGMLDGGFGDVTLDNLVDALKNGSGLSLADVVPGLPPGHTLHDLLAALLGTSAYDWSQLNLNTFPIADFSSDGGVAHYHADFEVTGGALLIQPVTIHATLPAGGRYVPHSSVRSPGGAIPDPTIGAGGQLSWSFNALRGQPYTLNWDVKPGLDLGGSAVGANIELSSGTTLATPVTTNVIQTFNSTDSPNGDTNDDPDTAPSLAGNSLYVSHLTKGDVDYYKIPIGPYGSRVEVTLSHIPSGSDYDLALAGPPAPRLRAAPANTIPLGNQELPDTKVELNHRDQPLPPEALQDVPTGELATSGRVVRGVADNRGSSPEHLSLLSQGEVGSWTIQISDYQGDSPDPYVLEVKSIPSPDFGPCAPRSIANSTVAAGPSVNSSTQTLFLVDEKRLIATFGSSATSTLMSKLSTLAGRSDVVGSVVRVETGPGVPAAYNAWDGSPCSPEAANNVVRTIGSYLDTLQASAPNLKYIVVVGGDDIVPFARVPDNTEIANERTYRESLGQVDNQYLSSIGQGFLLTDDVWGEKAAPQFLGSELFVPELAVGRLVESPTDIARTIDGFTVANGLLTPSSSLVTGYDFLTDGAQQINVPFAAGLGTNAKTLINETWDRTQLLAQLFPVGGGGPKLNSLNAHFDHQRLLPAAENAANRQSNLVTTADITAAMSGRLGFSLGCHSGLAVSDAIFGAANLLSSDWAQAMLGQGAAGWIGNTGYGLGDTTDVAYSERLHALFARKLDGTLTLGQALEQAKQDYLGTSAVLTGYDAKVMMEATLYGLPMLRLGSGIPPAPPPPPPLHTDPTTGLQAASFDVSPTFTRVTTANGKYDKADSGIQSTPRRPLEPLVSLDVTQPGTLVAHGALINLLNSPTADETSFDAVFSQVTTDQAADDPTLAGVNAFPSKIQSVATFSGLTSRKQRLNLVVGLFRSDGPTLAGIGTHRRYTRVAGDTLYSTSDDWLEPELGELQALRIVTGGTNVGFSAAVTDPTPSGPGSIVKTVKVVYRDCNGTWRTLTLSPAGGNRWSGGGTVLPASCINIDYYLEAADGAGNVAVSSKKVQLEPLTVPAPTTPAGASPITHVLSPVSPTASGWYGGPVQVTLSSAESIRYDVDGVETDYTGPFMVTGDGVHFIHAHTPLGATDDIGLGIDGTGPVTTITRTPGTPDANGWYGFSVTEQVSAIDPGGSDVAQIRCALDPAGAPPTLFSQLPASCPYAVANGGTIMIDGIHKLYAAAIDSAGNGGPVVSDTFQIDRTPPVATMGALPPFQTSQAFSPTWSGTDVGSGINNFDVRYRQAASNASSFGGYTTWQSATPALTAVFTGTAGATTCFSARARDHATWVGVYGAESCTATLLDDGAMTRSGSWSTTSAADLYGGSASRSTTYGGTLTSPTMVGKQFALLVTKQPGGGTIQVKWNGATQLTQSLSAATRQPKQLLTFTLGSLQSGTLQVYLPGYGTVDIDAVGAFKTP